MNVAVKNFSESQSFPNLSLRIYSEYWPSAQPPSPLRPPCSQLEYLPVGVLAPGQSWARADYQMDRGTQCTCVKTHVYGMPGLAYMRHLNTNLTSLVPTQRLMSIGSRAAILRRCRSASSEAWPSVPKLHEAHHRYM